jgi:hypothetical protein
MMDKINQARKAIAAFVLPALGVLGGALTDGHVSPEEWIAVAVAALVSSGLVYQVKNGTSADPTTSTPEI